MSQQKQTPATRTDGWEIREVRKSERSRFYLIGINHDAADEINREFRWHVQGIDHSDRYWLSPNCIGRELLEKV